MEIQELIQYFPMGHGALYEGIYPMVFVYGYQDGDEIMGINLTMARPGAPGRAISLHMVKMTSPVQVLNITEDQLDDEIIKYIDAIAKDYFGPDLPYPFKLNAAGSEIARTTRRGAGNVVITNKQNMNMLNSVYPPVQNIFSFIEREDVSDILIGYVGSPKPDRCIAVTKQSEDTFVFYAHPFAHDFWVRLTP